MYVRSISVSGGITGAEGLTIEIAMSYVHIVYPLIRETWCDLLPFLFDLQYERKETLDVCWRNIVAVGSLYQWLSFQIKNGDQACHVVV